MRSDSSTRLTRIQQVRRDDVIAAAVRVIGQEGYRFASIARIAEAADTSKSTVLYHFSSRKAVDRAVVEALFADGAAYMAREIVAADGVRDTLRAYLHSNLRFIAERREHVRAVHAIMANQPVGTGVDDPTAWLADLLASGQGSGELDPAFDPQVAALVIRAVIDAASHHLTALPDSDVEHHIEEATRLLRRAVGKEPS